jgi:hypothetical protein
MRLMGRKPVLTFQQMAAVGGECERIWRDRAEQAAMKEYDRRPYLQDVRKLQSELTAVPPAARRERVWRDTMKANSADISEILREASPEPVRVKRPYGARREVLDEASAWCASTYGITITRRRAQDCWDKFSAIEKRLAADLP